MLLYRDPCTKTPIIYLNFELSLNLVVTMTKKDPKMRSAPFHSLTFKFLFFASTPNFTVPRCFIVFFRAITYGSSPYRGENSMWQSAQESSRQRGEKSRYAKQENKKVFFSFSVFLLSEKVQASNSVLVRKHEKEIRAME